MAASHSATRQICSCPVWGWPTAFFLDQRGVELSSELDSVDHVHLTANVLQFAGLSKEMSMSSPCKWPVLVPVRPRHLLKFLLRRTASHVGGFGDYGQPPTGKHSECCVVEQQPGHPLLLPWTYYSQGLLYCAGLIHFSWKWHILPDSQLQRAYLATEESLPRLF